MSPLSGHTMIMSGGSRGIGLAIALRAAADGANITLIAKTDTPQPKLPGTIHTAARRHPGRGRQGAHRRRRHPRRHGRGSGRSRKTSAHLLVCQRADFSHASTWIGTCALLRHRARFVGVIFGP